MESIRQERVGRGGEVVDTTTNSAPFDNHTVEGIHVTFVL